MNLTALYNLFNGILRPIDALHPTSTTNWKVLSFEVGYLHELNTQQVDFPTLLMLPPKDHQATPRVKGTRTYDLRYFLIALDKNTAGESPCNAAERMTVWDTLTAKNRSIIEALNAANTSCQINGSVTEDRNSGGGDQIISDRVLWLDVTMTLSTNDC